MKYDIPTPEDIGKNTNDHEAIAKYYFEKGVEYACQQIQEDKIREEIRKEVMLNEFKMLKDFFERANFSPLQSGEDKLETFIRFREQYKFT